MSEKAQIDWKNIPKTKGIVLYDFPGSFEEEIYLKAGDEVHVYAEYDNSWYYGTCSCSQATGIFPASFIHLENQGYYKSERFHKFFPKHTPERIATETLVELGTEVQDYLRNKKFGEIKEFLETCQNLRKKRDFIVNSKTSSDVKAKIIPEILEMITGIKKEIGIELVVYDEKCIPLSIKNCGPLKLWHICIEKDPEKRSLLKRSISDFSRISEQTSPNQNNFLQLDNSPISPSESHKFSSFTKTSSLLSSLLDSFSPKKAKHNSFKVNNNNNNNKLSHSISLATTSNGFLSPRSETQSTSVFASLKNRSSNNGKSATLKVKGKDRQKMNSFLLDTSDFDISSRKLVVQTTLHFNVSVDKLSANLAGEICEFRFSVYSHSSDRFLSEPYVILVDEKGPLEKTNRLFIWKDIQIKETDTNIAILVTIHRRGKLQPSKDQKKKKEFYQFKRPVGAASFNITNNDSIQIFSRPLAFYSTSDLHWPNICELLQSPKEKDLSLLKNVSASICVQSFKNDQFDILSQELKKQGIPLNQIPILNALTLPDAFSISSYERNDLCLTLIQGEFGANDKIQICVELRDSKGQPYEFPVKYGGDSTNYRSQLILGQKNFQLNEVIVFNIDPRHYNRPLKLPECHIFFTFYQCSTDFLPKDLSKYAFGYSFLKLGNPSHPKIIIGNGPERLTIFKFPSKIPEEKTWYLTTEPIPRKNESFSLDFKLLSTNLTQTTELSKFLHWKKQKYRPDKSPILADFNTIPLTELLKYPGKFIKSILEMMTFDEEGADLTVMREPPSYSLDCFTILINFLHSIYESKSQELKAILHNIPNEQKHSKAAYYLLLHLSTYFNPMLYYKNVSNIDFLLKCFTVFPTLCHYIIRFYQQSIGTFHKTDMSTTPSKRKKKILGDSSLPVYESSFSDLSSVYEGQAFESEGNRSEKYTPVFRMIVSDLLDKLCILIGTDSPDFQKSVLHLALQEFSTLLKIFSYVKGDTPTVCAKLFQSLSINTTSESQCRSFLILTKTLINENENRSLGPAYKVIYPNLHKLIQKPHNFEMLQISVEVLGLILDRIEIGIDKFDSSKMQDIFESLLEKVISKKTQSRAQRLFFSTALLALLNGFGKEDFEKFPDKLIKNTLGFFESFSESEQPLYNKHWIDLNLYAFKVVAKVIVFIAQRFPQTCLSILVPILQSPSLALEKIPAAARERIFENFNDPRDIFAEGFEILWNFILEEKKLLQLETVIRFMLTRSPFAKSIACKLYRKILKSKTTNQVIIATIHSLDTVAREGKLDQDFERFFMPFLESVLGSNQEKEDSFEEFRNGIRLLVDLSKAHTRIEKIYAVSQLLTYLKRIGENKLYIQYIHRLSQLHIASQLFIEGGKSLLLHAQELEWNTEKQLESLYTVGYPFPPQTEFARKKTIYIEAIENFKRANCWEEAIALLREIQIPFRELKLYHQLASLLTQELSLIKFSLGKDRLYNSFFRVGCYGNACPVWMRNKEFIWRGVEGDRLASFVEKIKNAYPGANLLNHREKVDNSYKESQGINFQIFPVAVSCQEEFTTFCAIPPRAEGFPPRIAKALKHSQVNTFLVSKPWHKPSTPRQKTKNDDVSNLWTTNHFYITAESLPNTVGWSEIIKTKSIEYSPIQNAILTVLKKNQELEELYQTFEESPDPNVNNLTMALHGVIEAVVSGGTAVYRQIFFSEKFLKEEPENKNQVQKLKQALLDQVKVLDKGLILHKKMINPSLAPIHAKMEEDLRRLEKEQNLG